MKKLNPIYFIAYAFIFSTVLFSCSSKKMGFFNNSTSYPYVKASEQNDFYDNTSAGAERKNYNQERTFAPGIGAPVEKESSKPATQFRASEKPTMSSSLLSDKSVSKEKRKEVKKYIKENLKNNVKNESDVNIILLVILAILLPPLAVFLVDGIGTSFWISVILTLLFWLPGVIYALYRIFNRG